MNSTKSAMRTVNQRTLLHKFATSIDLPHHAFKADAAKEL
jgi:hypothetical protein